MFLLNSTENYDDSIVGKETVQAWGLTISRTEFMSLPLSTVSRLILRASLTSASGQKQDNKYSRSEREQI